MTNTTNSQHTPNGWEELNRRRKAFDLAIVALQLSDPRSILSWDEGQWEDARLVAQHLHHSSEATRTEACRMVNLILAALDFAKQ